MYLLSDAELAERGVKTRPRTLLEAIEAFDADPFTERVFGQDLKSAYVGAEVKGVVDYHNHISDWEIDRYLTFF
jgi:glutamine synthetase